MLDISLFGTFRVAVRGGPITNFRTDKVRALLAYLALEADRPHRREVLATLLWPDQPERAARLNLRQALFRLRQALSEGAVDPVLVTPGEVQFHIGEDTWVDARTFELLLATSAAHDHADMRQCEVCIAQLRQAVDLYEGPLLVGLAVADSEPFLEWLIPAQERFHHQALQALHTLAAHHLEKVEYDLAQQYAQRQIALEPWRETAHQQLMRALALSGQRGTALAQYRRCAEILAEELGVEPDAATTELADLIRDGALSPDPVWMAGGEAVQTATLPLPLSPFFGREGELAQLGEWLAAPDKRLITLVGPGGIGKTRLAMEAGLAHTGHFTHGACFVPLGTAESPPSLVSAIATALDLSLDGHTSPEQQLSDFLAEKSLLLLMDGFEAILASAMRLVDLLARAPGLKLLVTSRVRLNLIGEWVLPMEGFAVPEVADTRFDQVPAVQLFLLRAQQVRPTFAPGEADRQAILNICRLVEGIPLAIELAAGWLKALSCPAIESELRQSAALLLDHSQDDESLSSLEPIFEQSWRLLAPTERYVFRKLAVFPGSFDRRAAEAVAGTSLRELLRLIDHSFLRRSGTARYEAHDLLRQYGLARLSEVPHEMADTRNRHAAHFSAFLAERVPSLRGQHQRGALEEISQEIDNVRAAWDWSVGQALLRELGNALDGLFHFYDIRSWFEEGEARFSAARVALEGWRAGRPEASHGAMQSEATRLLGKVLAREGWFAFHRGEEQRALASLQRSLDLLRSIGARADLVFSLNYLAAVNYYGGDYESAQALCDESRAVAGEISDEHGIAIASNISAQIAFAQGDYQAAEAYSQASLAIERAIGNRWSMAFSLFNLGNVAYAQGRYEAAKQQFEESLAIREEMEDFRGIANCYNRLGETAEAVNDPQEAQTRYAESLSLFRSIGDRWGVMATQIKLGRIALTLGQGDEAETLLRTALADSVALHAPPMTLEALVQWSRLLLQRGKMSHAGGLLRFVREHSATSQETEDEAEHLLTELGPQLPVSGGQAAQDMDEGMSLEALVGRLLEEG